MYIAEMRLISRTVWILSIVSMFADIASEMLYPIIPVYLKSIGFSVLLIGLFEGIAEFIVGISKGYFGKLSDEKGVRLPFIRWGYLLSAVSKPMMAIFTYPAWILFARTTDRLGKGIRTAARDALLSQQATSSTKARVFGFHRAWDTTGAIVGPVLALVLLHYFPKDYASVFYIAFVPGLISVLLIYLLREIKNPRPAIHKNNFFSFFGYWNKANRSYRSLVVAFAVFALANSSDVFLLLKVKDITGSDQTTIAVYILYNIVFALTSYPMGMAADKVGMKKVFLAGLILFSLVYGGFVFVTTPVAAYLLFAVYGIYAAATQGIARAWISNLSDRNFLATSIGLFTSIQSIATLFASIVAGLLWTCCGSESVFLFSALLALLVFSFLLFTRSGQEA